MIQGMHGMFYTDDAKALREFIRDKLDDEELCPRQDVAFAAGLTN